MIYYSKTSDTDVNAIYYDGENISEVINFVDENEGRIISETISDGCIPQTKAYFLVNWQDEKMLIYPEDYVVVDEFGDWFVLYKEQFEEEYKESDSWS